MIIQPTTGYTKPTRGSSSEKKPPATRTSPSSSTKKDSAVVFEKTASVQKGLAGYSALGKSRRAISDVQHLKLQMEAQMKDAFFLMVKNTVKGQNVGMKRSLEALLSKWAKHADPDMISKAKKSIEPDGFFSAEAVSKRILSFAKAISGNDPKQGAALREAFKKGFKEATRIWGDKLPDISQKTYDAVMEGFDKWESEKTPSPVL